MEDSWNGDRYKNFTPCIEKPGQKKNKPAKMENRSEK